MMKEKHLNRNQLKYIVIIAMLIDHIAWGFVPMDSVLAQIMHFIGRLTGPTMAFFLVEGYLHTRNVKKYLLRLGIFGLISWIPFSLFECGKLPILLASGENTKYSMLNIYFQQSNKTLSIFPCLGVLYTLFLSLLAVWLWDKGRCPKPVKVLGVIGLCVLSIMGDWPIWDVLYAMILFIYHESPKKKWIWFCALTAISIILEGISFHHIYELGIFMVPILIQCCYNGERGSNKPIHKWFFYVFYPAHLIILALIKFLI